MIAGENSLQGAYREVAEELGLQLDDKAAKLLRREVRQVDHLDNWLFHSNVSIEQLTFQPEEVIDAKWVDEETYRRMVRQKAIVPTLHHFFDELMVK